MIGTATLSDASRRTIARLGRAALLALVVSLFWTAAAAAATIKVTTTKDAAPTAGECSGHNRCSLRQAVDKAASGDTVSIPSNKHQRYVLTLGPIVFAKVITIRGGGAKTTVIDGHGSNGVFIQTGASSSSAALTIEDVTITGSNATGPLSHTDSGAIVNEASGLKLANCVITKNAASAPTSPSSVVGGAVDSEGGNLTISHCSITNNHMNTSSDGSVGGGGVVSEGGLLHISDSNITANKATMNGLQPIIAGGVVSEGGSLRITNSTVANNSANATNVSFQSDGAGGVLSDGGPATLTNVTIAGNKDQGPGNFNAGGFNNDGGGTGKFMYVTLAHNSGGAAANLVSSNAVFEPFGSVFALAPSGQADCRIVGTSSSQGYNFADDSSCSLTGSHDRTHGNPMLGKLKSNGGPGPTMALAKGSPLIDFIPKAQCPSAIKTDERGRPRPDDGEQACDIGAYEFQDK